jgi:hypothetical protein
MFMPSNVPIIDTLKGIYLISITKHTLNRYRDWFNNNLKSTSHIKAHTIYMLRL